MSATYSALVSTLFRVGVRDTQTGCKVFRRDVLAELLPRLHECGYAIDLELFVAARRAGITDFVGAPVDIGGRLNGSTIGYAAIVRMIRDTLAIYGRHHLGRASGTRQASPGPVKIRYAEHPAELHSEA